MNHLDVTAVTAPPSDMQRDASSGPSCGRCAACGARSYPVAPICEVCLSEDIRVEPMPPRGSLYSYTVVRLGETPRALGYVDLPNGLRVLADISPLDRLAMDVAVELMPAVESPDAPLCFGVTEE